MTEGQEAQVQEPISNEPQYSVQELAAFAFNEQMPIPPTAEGDASPPINQPTTEVVAPSNADAPVVIPAPITTPIVEDEIVDDVVYLKQQLGYDNWESAKAALEDYNKLKATPQTAAEIAFANDESKKVHQLLREGKVKEVVEHYQAKELMAGLETMSNEQKLKLYIKSQNPRFDSELIQDEYDSLYKIDEESIDDPLKLRKERVRMEQRLENDVKKADEYFSTYKAKIELPDIQPPTPNVVDDGYEEYKASNAKSIEAYNNIVAPAIKSLKQGDVKLGVSVNDPNNQMVFDIDLTPDPQDFEEARQDALSVLDFLTKTCYDKDGKFVPTELQKLVLVKKNFEKYVYAAAKQAVNAERKRVIEKDTAGNGVRRDYSVVSPEVKTELEKQAAMAFSI